MDNIKIPSNEWKIEQGLAIHGVRDQTVQNGEVTNSKEHLDPEPQPEIPESRYDVPDHGKIDPEKEFAEESTGWGGYVEWEKYPEKKAKARAILARCIFPPPPEFQLGPVPDQNPVNVPEESWATVKQEKHPEMLHLLEFPYNGEPPKRLVTQKPVTPNSLHFVRNHGGIPDISASEFHLELDGLVKNPKKLTMADLMNETIFPRQTNLVTVQCSGTRRLEQINEYAGEGDEMINAPWAEGAIGTAKWTGVSLKKVIKHCGGLIDGGKHLELYGADTYVKQGELMNYVVSVPFSKVKLNEVLLAWEMNDSPLPKIHGFPLRAIVMGYIGARSVKWLYRIKAIPHPSRAPVQSKEYLYFNQQVGKHNQAYTKGIQIQEMPVSSAIMEPWNKEVVVHDGIVKVKGWAYSGGGRWPERVEVSPDGGFIWYEVPVRCWDNSLNTQPTYVRSAWNWGLHVTSSCHRVKIYSVNKRKEDTRKRLQEFEDRGIPFAPLTRPTTFATQSAEDYEKFWAEHAPRDVED